LFTQLLAAFGIKFHFVGMADVRNIEKYITENTKLIWVETPTNPLMHIIDIAACAELAQEHNVMLCVDNTFASPWFQNPLDLGADVVVHSATKYLGGHSDVVLGALIVKDDELA